jgi:SOS-response transcriptional repressor LexA
MSPTLLDGDVIAVSETLPATGDICIALHRTDGILCKRWYWKNGVIRLESINPEGRTYEWTKEAFTAEAPLVWRFRVEALVYRKLS